MGKSKSAAQAVAAAPSKVLNGVKGGKVSKPVKGKDISKSSVVKKELEKHVKNKAPTPSDSEDSSSSESESDSESDNDSDASESEADVKPKAVSQKPDTNGVNGSKKDVANDDSSSEEDSDSDSDDSDDSAPAVKANGVKPTAVATGAAQDSDSDSSDSSDSEDSVADQAARFQPDSDASDSDDSDDSDSASDDEDEAPVAKTNGAAKAAVEADDSEEDDSEDDSEDGSSSEEEAEKPKVEAKKRKADESAEPATKKTKVDEAAADESGASKTLFVGHLSWGVDEDGLYKEFESFGDIASCKIMYHADSGKSKGFGYVEFTDIANAITAKNEMHEKMIDGREVNIDFATPRVERPRPSGDERAKKYGDVESAPSDTIFVGNISFDATYDHIKEAFEQYGTITRISLPTDRESGQPKGFGYVGFSSVEEATEALNALKGADIAGRQVRLDFAQARQDDGGARGGRGGGRGGFDRGGRGGGRGFGGRGGGRGGFDRGGRGGGRGFGGDRGGRGRGGSNFNRGGFGDFAGKKTSF